MPTLDEFEEGFKQAGGSHMLHVDNIIHKLVEEIKQLKATKALERIEVSTKTDSNPKPTKKT